MKKLLILLAVLATLTLYTRPTLGQETATDEADSVRDRVREKLEEAVNKPKAYLGVATDKTDTGIQIESTKGEILQIAIHEVDTSFASVNSKTEDATFDDLAIGDFIVAMGIVNDNGLLEAQRILLTDPIEKPKRQIVWGTVKEIDGKDLTIIKKDGTETSATFPRRWKGPEIKELEEGQDIVMVTLPEDGELTIRTIQLANSASQN